MQEGRVGLKSRGISHPWPLSKTLCSPKALFPFTRYNKTVVPVSGKFQGWVGRWVSVRVGRLFAAAPVQLPKVHFG